jgi:glutamyl-tRNA synthetase
VRFAPSPTGRFHIGNLRTAWISYRWSQHLELPWIIRFEDIDAPRSLKGALENQLADMAALGMVPNLGSWQKQSEFRSRHWDLFCRGITLGQIYPCDCSRKEVQAALLGIASAPHDGRAPVYSGTCRKLDRLRPLQAGESVAWRFRMENDHGLEDFIIARSSAKLNSQGLPEEASYAPAYHWACAIDDYDGDFDLLVRSHDLKHAAPLQRAIQKWLGTVEGESRVPAIFHTSLVVQNDGHRLEKRTPGVTLDDLPLTPQEILRAFEESFALDNFAFHPFPGGMAGEPKEELLLRDLLKS